MPLVVAAVDQGVLGDVLFEVGGERCESHTDASKLIDRTEVEREAFKRHNDRAEFFEFTCAERHEAKPLPVFAFNLTFTFERDQRLAKRRSADTEFGSQLDFVDAFTRTHLSGAHARQKFFAHLGAKRFPFNCHGSSRPSAVPGPRFAEGLTHFGSSRTLLYTEYSYAFRVVKLTRQGAGD